MAVINDPGLNEIGRQIISEQGFDPGDTASLRRAWEQWVARTTPVQRLAAEQAHFLEWLGGLHWEKRREAERERRGGPVAVGPGGLVSGQVVDAMPAVAAEPVVPVSEVKFSSQSPEWREPEPERREPERARPQAPPAWEREPSPPVRRDPPSPRFGPVHVRPAPVQQPSRKIAQYRQMFPELGRPVATESGPKELADCDAGDIAFRIRDVAAHRQALRTANSNDEARIEDRERLNAKDRVRVAERQRNLSDAQALEQRLTAAAKAMSEHGAAVVGELPAEALAECGFTMRVA